MEKKTLTNNKRIARNTLFLYVRQFFVLGISLYTSRLILSTLGVVDYGIYDVIGGVVALVATVNFAMTCATVRFLTFQLGREDKDGLNEAFSNSLIIHGFIATIIIVIGEIFGPYFVTHCLTIPIERLDAAQYVFQFSVFACAIAIITVPFNSLVTAYERMDAFAIISIIGAFLRLAIVFLLLVTPYDRLIFYSWLILLVGVVNFLLYFFYTRKTIAEVRFITPQKSGMRKEMISYASWSMIGSTGVMFSNQGQNVLLNIFFGPAVNAARAIALQVCNAVNNLTSSLYQAIAPQINKSYASGNIEYMKQLILSSSKYTYFLLFFLILPIYYTGKFVLKVWLEAVPEGSAIFMYLLLASCVFTALGQPISTAVGATGNIKRYQMIEGGLQVLILFVSWFFLKLFTFPEVVFIVHVIMSIIIQVIRLLIICPMISLRKVDYLLFVVKPCVLVTFLSVALTIGIKMYININWITFFLFNIYTVLVIGFSIYFWGLDRGEKEFINRYATRIIKKKRDEN